MNIPKIYLTATDSILLLAPRWNGWISALWTNKWITDSLSIGIPVHLSMPQFYNNKMGITQKYFCLTNPCHTHHYHHSSPAQTHTHHTHTLPKKLEETRETCQFLGKNFCCLIDFFLWNKELKKEKRNLSFPLSKGIEQRTEREEISMFHRPLRIYIHVMVGKLCLLKWASITI